MFANVPLPTISVSTLTTKEAKISSRKERKAARRQALGWRMEEAAS